MKHWPLRWQLAFLTAALVGVVLSIPYAEVFNQLAKLSDVRVRMTPLGFLEGFFPALLVGLASAAYPAWLLSRTGPSDRARGGAVDAHTPDRPGSAGDHLRVDDNLPLGRLTSGRDHDDARARNWATCGWCALWPPSTLITWPVM